MVGVYHLDVTKAVVTPNNIAATTAEFTELQLDFNIIQGVLSQNFISGSSDVKLGNAE